MSIQINTTLYSSILADINSILTRSQPIQISIFENSEGLNPLIDNKQFAGICYRYPIDNVEGYLELSFADGSSIKVDDITDNYWYIVNGVTAIPTILK
jgi:hypothetical protein